MRVDVPYSLELKDDNPDKGTETNSNFDKTNEVDYALLKDDNPDKGTETIRSHMLMQHPFQLKDDNPDKGTETYPFYSLSILPVYQR